MSDLVIETVAIDKVKPHPNADRLEIVEIGGWQVVAGKGNHEAGDVVVYIPPDAMIPEDVASRWGVSDYLKWRGQVRTKGRVKVVKLRGEFSYGFIAPNETGDDIGVDLAAHYDIDKYEEPIGHQAGPKSNEHPLFHRYTSINNLRNSKYSKLLNYGEPLVVTEKIHGTNSRIGWIRIDGNLELAIGTHRTQLQTELAGTYRLPLDTYTMPFYDLYNWIMDAAETGEWEYINSIIVFGEIYGKGVQHLHYGAENKDYRVFDIAVNGKYLHEDAMRYICEQVGLPVVPRLSLGVFTFETLLEMAEGDTTLKDSHIREGIVVRPMVENVTNRGERMIFKVIGGGYLAETNRTEHH